MPTSDVWMSSSGLHKVSSSLLLFTVSVAADATRHYAFQHRSSWCCVCLHGGVCNLMKIYWNYPGFWNPSWKYWKYPGYHYVTFTQPKANFFHHCFYWATSGTVYLLTAKTRSQSWWRLQIINWNVVRSLFWLCKSNLVIALFQPDETLYWFPNLSLNKVDSSSNVWC